MPMGAMVEIDCSRVTLKIMEQGVVFQLPYILCYNVLCDFDFLKIIKAQTNLNVIIFYDVSDVDDVSRYEMIKAHILTRAVENVTYTATVNAIAPFQTAPTILYNIFFLICSLGCSIVYCCRRYYQCSWRNLIIPKLLIALLYRQDIVRYQNYNAHQRKYDRRTR